MLAIRAAIAEHPTIGGRKVTEPAAIEPLSNGVRIRIGDAQKTVAPGDHRYVIRYRTTRQIGRFAGYDELYWNVTGNGWVFPIDVAEAHIRLPSPVKFGQRAVYTGAQGSTAGNATITSNGATVEGTTGADLCQDPAAYYVNYHTTVFPLGAIRGQQQNWRDPIAFVALDAPVEAGRGDHEGGALTAHDAE